MGLAFLFAELGLGREEALLKLSATMLELFELQVSLEGLMV